MRWIPLESNPEVMNKFIRELGIKEPLRFEDVYGTDSTMQALVPCPVLSLLLVYPLNENTAANPIGTVAHDEKCFFMKQTISNACGTVALIHALANNKHVFDIKSVPWLNQFLEKTKEISPKDRALALEKEEELIELHENCAQKGQTDIPDPESRINLHFIAFINVDGHLVELDGRKDGPIFHGNTSGVTFLADACKVVDKFMARDPTNVSFSLIALTNGPL